MNQAMKPRSKVGPTVRLLPVAGEVVVRMYRVGHGDCFLLAFGRPARDPFYMLIDCGAEDSGHPAPLSQVAADIAAATLGHLDVLVISHEHKDHISGFHAGETVRKVFEEQMRIDHLWLAWTEKGETGDRSRDERKRIRKLVEAALEENPSDKRVKMRLETARKNLGDDTTCANHEAMSWLQATCGKTSYLEPRRSIEIEGLQGVARVHVLGPPEDIAQLFTAGKPTKKEENSEETYPRALAEVPTIETSFAAALGIAGGDEPASVARKNSLCPFDRRYALKPDDARSFQLPAQSLDRLSTEVDPFFFRSHYFKKGISATRRIDDEWLAPAAEYALNVQSHANNACLVLAIELVESEHVLLFPGDAEIGNWLSWIDASWSVAKADGSESRVSVRDLLRRTVLYKVGHHGSYNGTLRKDGLEIMGAEGGRERCFTALLPVNERGASKRFQLPNQPVVDGLLNRTDGRLVRSDEDDLEDQKTISKPKLKRNFKGIVTKTTTSHYFDLTIRSSHRSWPYADANPGQSILKARKTLS